jgi:hypothetical protein
LSTRFMTLFFLCRNVPWHPGGDSNPRFFFHMRRLTTTLHSQGVFLLFFWVSDPLCLSSSLALHFFWLFFLVHHLVNRDDRHLLAHAMASDFSVAWQCLSKRTIVFFVTDQTPRPKHSQGVSKLKIRP